MTITESLKYEFYVIMGILFFGAIFGLEESQNYWRWDIGRCIFAIGALWLVGSMFRFYPSLIHNYASIIAAISVFLLGFSIHEYGIFTALIVVGGAFLYFAYMSHPLAPYQATIMFTIAIPLMVLGLILRPLDIPTDPLKHYHPITQNIKWTAFVYYEGDNDNGTNLATIVGSEEKAYVETRNVVEKWKENNPSLHIREVQVRLSHDSYDSTYDNAIVDGYSPTHELFKLKKYPLKNIPKELNLTDLEN